MSFLPEFPMSGPALNFVMRLIFFLRVEQARPELVQNTTVNVVVWFNVKFPHYEVTNLEAVRHMSAPAADPCLPRNMGAHCANGVAIVVQVNDLIC